MFHYPTLIKQLFTDQLILAEGEQWVSDWVLDLIPDAAYAIFGWTAMITVFYLLG